MGGRSGLGGRLVLLLDSGGKGKGSGRRGGRKGEGEHRGKRIEKRGDWADGAFTVTCS